MAAIVAAAGALMWTTRGALRGAPVADDWAFLHHIRFASFNLWDSHGAAYYWRPITRQLGMNMEALWMERAPWLGALVHLMLLMALAVILERILRRALPAAPAALLACAPLLTEASRALLIWPSGVQHLFAMLATALAVHEMLARRLPTALLAAALALGSHESSVLLVPVLMRTAREPSLPPRARRAWLLAPLALFVAWLSGYAIARGHGVHLPPAPTWSLTPLARIPELARHLYEALLGLEDLPARAALLLGVSHALVVAIALFRARRLSAAHRRAFALTMLAGAVAALPLVWLLPDWNAWRASLPLLALGIGLGGLLAGIDARLAYAFVTLRVVALLLAPTATLTTLEVPRTRSDLSFVRIARLQRIVTETRRELLATHPTLPRGARVRYWTMPGLAEVGFQQEQAAKVWYHDTTLTFRGFGGLAGLDDPPDVVIAYDGTESEHPAVSMTAPALRLYGLAHAAAQRGDARAVDSLGALTLAAQPRAIRGLTGQVQFARASARVLLGDDRGADSLLAITLDRMPDHAAALALAARIALRRGAARQAWALATRALELDEHEELARQVLEQLAKSPLAP